MTGSSDNIPDFEQSPANRPESGSSPYAPWLPSSDFPIASGFEPPPSRTNYWLVAVAWLVITAIVGIKFSQQFIEPEEAAEQSTEDSMGDLIQLLQMRYLVGANEILQSFGFGDAFSAGLADALEVLNIGNVTQRQRVIILAAEIGGSEAAAFQRLYVENLIDKLNRELTPDQQQVQRILNALYPIPVLVDKKLDMDPDADPDATADAGLVERVDSLEQTDRDLLIEKMGWFGELALAPKTATDSNARKKVLKPAVRVATTLFSVLIMGGLVGLAGLIGLIIVMVMMFHRKLGNGLTSARDCHGIYAETFALWLVIFMILLFVPKWIGITSAFDGLLITLGAFFISLLVLLWPIWRGIPRHSVMQDIGWTTGRGVVKETLMGLAGYAMALPILFVGLIGTWTFIMIQNSLLPDTGPSLDSVGSGPAHPIIEFLSGPDMGLKLMALILGAVAAPIVEETMFRGVLYRHLRGFSTGMGIGVSVLFSATFNGLIFAAIHPQGWVAIPVLGSLGFAFCLMREWRGSLLPSMLMHGISNAIMLTLMMFMFSN